MSKTLEVEDGEISCPELPIKINPKGLGFEIFSCLNKYSDQLFQIDSLTGKTETFGEVLKKCVRTSIELQKRGLITNDIISICSHNHLNVIVPIISGLFIGTKIASLDPGLSLDDYTILLKQVQPKMIFVSRRSSENIQEALRRNSLNVEVIVFEENFEDFMKISPLEDEFKPVVVKNEKETAFIFFSSGTTGLPKGICLSHQTMSYISSVIKELIFQDCHYTILTFSTTYWVSSINLLLIEIFYGYSRIVAPEYDPENFWRIMKAFKVNCFLSAPSLVFGILARKCEDVELPLNFMVLTGGGPASSTQILEFRSKFGTNQVYFMYGTTETGGMVTIQYPKTEEGRKISQNHPGSCGRPLPGMTYKIVDVDTREPVPHGQPGELLLKTNYQLNGYHNLDSSNCWEDGWLKTGDVVLYHPDGCFYHVDRVKEMFKYKVWHIQPVIVEEILMRHPAVLQAVVVGCPHPEDGCHPMGVVKLKNGYERTNPESIRRFVDEQVDDAKKLRAGVKIVDSILVSSTGKIKRLEIRNMVCNKK